MISCKNCCLNFTIRMTTDGRTIGDLQAYYRSAHALSLPLTETDAMPLAVC